MLFLTLSRVCPGGLSRRWRRLLFSLLLTCALCCGAAAQDAVGLSILGAPQAYDLAKEEPHIASKLRFGPNGAILSAWRRSGRVEFWSLASGTAEVRWDSATVYTDSPDLQEAVGLVSGRLKLMSTGRSERQRGMAPSHLALSGNQRLALAADTPGVVLRDLQTGQARGFGTELPVRNGLAISPDGRYIVAAVGNYVDGQHQTAIEIHDIHENRRDVLRSPGVVLGMWQLSISASNRLALSTQRNGKSGVMVLDLASNAPVLEQGAFESYWVRGLALSKDGSVLVTGDEKGKLRVWNVSENRRVFEHLAAQPIQAVAIDHPRRKLAWSLWDGTIHVVTMSANYASVTAQGEQGQAGSTEQD